LQFAKEVKLPPRVAFRAVKKGLPQGFPGVENDSVQFRHLFVGDLDVIARS